MSRLLTLIEHDRIRLPDTPETGAIVSALKDFRMTRTGPANLIAEAKTGRPEF